MKTTPQKITLEELRDLPTPTLAEHWDVGEPPAQLADRVANALTHNATPALAPRWQPAPRLAWVALALFLLVGGAVALWMALPPQTAEPALSNSPTSTPETASPVLPESPPTEAPAAEPEPEIPELVVDVQPEEALIELLNAQGQAVLTSRLGELRTRWDNREGYRLRVSHPGYSVYNTPLSSQGQELTVTLEELVWRVTVETEPQGAEVKLDGVVMGLAPIVLNPVPGEKRVLTVSREGYSEVTRDLEFDPEAGMSTQNDNLVVTLGKRQSLPPQPAAGDGELEVRAIPWGQITIDGKRLGNKPVSKAYPPGKHKVEIYYPPKKKKVSRVVTVKSGKTTEVRYDFNRGKWR